MLLLLAATLWFSPQNGKPVETPSHAINPHTPGNRLLNKNIPNFGQVTANLYRGGQPSPEGLQDLKKLGVEIVVDMRGGRQESENKIADKLGMRYISIPSHCPFPTDKPWAQFLTVIRGNPGRKIFVHCRLGDDRTGMAVASYRMADEGWTPNEAMKEMQNFGFTTIHYAMCPGMARYEQAFPKRLQTSPEFKNLR
jgi:protein tyrosine/serine phosphatase